MIGKNAVKILGTKCIGSPCGWYWDYDSLEKVENYEQAINDTTQTWDLHHRAEINEEVCLYVSKDVLEHFGLYKDRHYSELIFLPSSEHHALHAPYNHCLITIDHLISKAVDENELKHKLCECITKMHVLALKNEIAEKHDIYKNAYQTAFNNYEALQEKRRKSSEFAEKQELEVSINAQNDACELFEHKAKLYSELYLMTQFYDNEISKYRDKCNRYSNFIKKLAEGGEELEEFYDKYKREA